MDEQEPKTKVLMMHKKAETKIELEVIPDADGNAEIVFHAGPMPIHIMYHLADHISAAVTDFAEEIGAVGLHETVVKDAKTGEEIAKESTTFGGYNPPKGTVH